MDNRKPFVGKTQAYEVYVEQTPTGHAIPEPTFQGKPPVYARPQGQAQAQPQPQHDEEVEEDGEEEEVPVKTVKRMKIPGMRHPTWGW
jgi:hypothetical protein